MKNFTFKHIVFLTCLFLGTTLMQAQDITVIHENESSDGTSKVVKKRFDNSEEAEAYMETLKKAPDGPTNIKMRVNTGDGIVNIIKNKLNYSYSWKEGSHSSHGSYRSDRPFLGINLDDEGEGILVTNIVNGSGAEAAGLQSGDRILSIDGETVETHNDLRVELSKHEVGDAIDIVYARAGQSSQTEATLTERIRQSRERDPCKVFIGVNVGGRGQNSQGVRVSGIISGTSAEASKVMAGDIITALDGISVNTFSELLAERNKHQPGDYFTLSVLREGQPMQINAQFKSCEQKEEPAPEVVEEIVEEVVEEPAEELVEEAAPELPLIEMDNTLEPAVFNVFPNPSFGQFNVKFQAEALPTLIRVLDVSGKEVYRENIRNFDGYYEKELNLGDNAAKTLFLQIQQGDKLVTQQLKIFPKA